MLAAVADNDLTETLKFGPFKITYAGVSGLVVRVSDSNFQVAGSNLTAGHLQATLSKLLTYGVLRSTQPPTLRGTGMSSSLRATG